MFVFLNIKRKGEIILMLPVFNEYRKMLKDFNIDLS